MRYQIFTPFELLWIGILQFDIIMLVPLKVPDLPNCSLCQLHLQPQQAAVSLRKKLEKASNSKKKHKKVKPIKCCTRWRRWHKEFRVLKMLFRLRSQSFFTHNSLASEGECSRRKGVKKRGVLDCVVLSGGVSGEQPLIRQSTSALPRTVGRQRLMLQVSCGSVFHTYTQTLRLVVLWDNGEWWLCLLKTDSGSLLPPKSPF